METASGDCCIQKEKKGTDKKPKTIPTPKIISLENCPGTNVKLH